MRKLQRLRSKRIKRDRGQFWKKSARVNPNGPNLCIIPLTCFFLWGGNSGWQVLWSGSKNVEPNKISYWLGVNKINAPTSILRRTWVFTHHLSAPQRSSFRNSLGSSATVKPLAAKAAWPLPSQGEPARGTRHPAVPGCFQSSPSHAGQAQTSACTKNTQTQNPQNPQELFKIPPFSLALSFNSFNRPDLLVGLDPQLLPRQFQEPVSLLRTSLSQIRDLSRRWSKQLSGPRWFLLPIRVPLTPARNSV